MRRQSSPLAHQPVGDLAGMISAWRDGEGLGKHMTAIRRVPGKAAEYGAWPQALAPQARQAIERRGMHALYSHQSEAITHALAGEHVVVVTPTASGKTDLAQAAPVAQTPADDAAAFTLWSRTTGRPVPSSRASPSSFSASQSFATSASAR